MAGGDQDVDLGAQRRDVLAEVLKIGRIGPGDYHRWNAGPIGWWDTRMQPAYRHMIGGMAVQELDAGGVCARLAVGPPIDRTALHNADRKSAAFEHRRN